MQHKPIGFKTATLSVMAAMVRAFPNALHARYMYACAYVCMYVCTHTHARTHARTNTRTQAHARTRAHTHHTGAWRADKTAWRDAHRAHIGDHPDRSAALALPACGRGKPVILARDVWALCVRESVCEYVWSWVLM